MEGDSVHSRTTREVALGVMSYKLVISDRENNGLIALIVIGLLGAALGLLLNTARLWPSFLVNAFFFLTLALGAMVFVCIHHVSNAGWSTALKRVPDAMRMKAAFLNTPFFFGRMAVVLAIWCGSAFLLWRESRRQDEDGLLEHTDRSK